MRCIHYNLKKGVLFATFFATLFILLSVISTYTAAACTKDSECLGGLVCRNPGLINSACVPQLESGIPGVGPTGAQGAAVPTIPTYVNYLYIFVLSFVGIAGFISIVIWGTTWIASAVVDKKAQALEGIKNTLIGIGIALTAFIILYTINPDLTLIKEPTVKKPSGGGISSPSFGQDHLCKNISPTYTSCLKDSLGCIPYTIDLNTMKKVSSTTAGGRLYGVFCKSITVDATPASCTPDFIELCKQAALASGKVYAGCAAVEGKATCSYTNP